MAHKLDKIIEYSEKCLLPRLSKSFYESEEHFEYQLRENNLEEHFQKIIDLIKDVDLYQQTENTSNALCSIVLLYLELQIPNKLTKSRTKEFSVILFDTFKSKSGIALNQIFMKDKFNTQDVFDMCLKYLHQRMTPQDFQKYPGLIDVYCMLMQNIKEYKVVLNAIAVLPLSLILNDDFIIRNKVKGLQSCLAILQCMTSKGFAEGNYYEVVYSSLRKNIVEKDIQVTKCLLKCMLELLQILPPDVKKNKLDDIFSTVLNQLQTESNLYRKAECFIFITKIIEMHKIHCVKMSIFKTVIYDNINECANDAVGEILLPHVIMCLNSWIKHCWCIWRLSSDQKMLSLLFKILYATNDNVTIPQIQNLIITLISLCNKEEQKQISESLETIPKFSNLIFLERIETIKRGLAFYYLFYLLYNINSIKISEFNSKIQRYLYLYITLIPSGMYFRHLQLEIHISGT